jgi:hypothetical protein
MPRPMPTSARVAAPASPWSDAPLGVRRPPARAAAPWGVLLGLAAALLACRAREGDRCVCAEDCREGLLCVASGRVLAAGDCSPAVGEGASPGVCLPAEEAAEGDDGGGLPEVFMDLGSKYDFEPGPPPDPETGTGSGTAGTGMTGSSSDGGTTDATGTSSGGSSSGTTGSSSSSGGTTDATGSSSGSSGSTGGT